MPKFNMPEKRIKKSHSKTEKKPSHTAVKPVTHSKGAELEKTLVKNLVELQKVHTNLAEKFDKLSKEISHLLALFEMTARSFAKKLPPGDIVKDKEFLDKIDALLDQNKTIAKGLTLMEERFREKVYGNPPERERHGEDSFRPSLGSRNRPLPRF